MEQQKVKFIQLHKQAHPIKFDGFGFRIPFIDGVPMHRKDGRDVIVAFTGYKIVIPEGYIGQVYDTSVASVNSIQRLELTQFVTNEFPYETEPDKEAIGYYIAYLVTGGISSFLFNRQEACIGINFFKKHGIQNMEIEVDIKHPKQPENNGAKPEKGNHPNNGMRPPKVNFNQQHKHNQQ